MSETTKGDWVGLPPFKEVGLGAEEYLAFAESMNKAVTIGALTDAEADVLRNLGNRMEAMANNPEERAKFSMTLEEKVVLLKLLVNLRNLFTQAKEDWMSRNPTDQPPPPAEPE